MIKGTRIQASNITSAVTVYSAGLSTAFPLLTLPTGKSFIMTDLVVGFTPADNLTDTAQLPGVLLEDLAEAAGTVPLTENVKFVARSQLITPQSTLHTSTSAPRSIIVTGLVNGPEFSTCLAIANLCSLSIPTYGVFVSGILR